jgi:hypothetical protein
MIRRDIRLADGSAGWMLISQIEHARISAELAAHCTGRFGGESDVASSEVRNEVLAAILHHDDGWAEWEQSPQLDRASGRPLAFTELAVADALAVWTRSVEAAAAIGPLAAWMVSGHFLRLANHSETTRENADFKTWKSQFGARRIAWLALWQSGDPGRLTRGLADEALQWLWTFDEVSLWLCCTCLLHEPIPCAPEPYSAGHGTPIEMELHAGGPELAVLRPWRFDRETLEVTISGRQVTAARYRNSAELHAAGAQASLHWRLTKEK